VARHSPVLQFLEPAQTVELSPADAERLGVGSGTPVQIAANGTRLRATAQVRAGVPEGSAFLIEGIEDQPVGLLLDGQPQTVEITPG
jgi:anaerobic selenocysteine-containing dehydrogenase